MRTGTSVTEIVDRPPDERRDHAFTRRAVTRRAPHRGARRPRHRRCDQRSSLRAYVRTVRGQFAHALYRSLQIRFRVDEKLAGHDDAVAVANALANLRLSVAFDARLHVGGREAPCPLGDDDDGTL